MMKKLFNLLARWFGTGREQSSREAPSKKREKATPDAPSPPRETSTPRRTRPPKETKPYPSPPPKTKKEPPKPTEPKKKTKPSKPPNRPKKGKKGIPTLSDKDDLADLFNAKDGQPGKQKPREDFGKLLDQSLTDKFHLQLLDQKKKVGDGTKPINLTVTERVRLFPPVQQEIDLHGYTAAEALPRVTAFVQGCRKRGLRTVRIIVGKGTHSQGKAVLPDITETELVRLKNERALLSFQWEKKDKRKSGAVLVYLMPWKE